MSSTHALVDLSTHEAFPLPYDRLAALTENVNGAAAPSTLKEPIAKFASLSPPPVEKTTPGVSSLPFKSAVPPTKNTEVAPTSENQPASRDHRERALFPSHRAVEDITTGVHLPRPERATATAAVTKEPVDDEEFSIRQGKGKGCVAVPAKQSIPPMSPQESKGRLRVPSITVTDTSGAGTTSLPRPLEITYNPVSKVGQISATPSADDDDYPRIGNGPRAIHRKGMPPHVKRVRLQKPQNMCKHSPVAWYAGDPLFRLCTAVPYALGPMVLITRIQLLTESTLSLPDEVKELLTSNDIDPAQLSTYDIALLNILGCLWDD